tara:strand:+ start:1662 stop:1862 length:201 start_codon:yes stop_codon:yes gene_type:complete
MDKDTKIKIIKNEENKIYFIFKLKKSLKKINIIKVKEKNIINILDERRIKINVTIKNRYLLNELLL